MSVSFMEEIQPFILKEEDEYGVKWKNVELNFEVKDPSAIKNTKDGLWATEEELYLSYGSCHVAKKLEEYTINQWPNVVKTMSDRAGLAKMRQGLLARIYNTNY